MKTILVGSTLATLTGLALAQDLGMKQHGDIRWACGGVGVEERAALAARAIPQTDCRISVEDRPPHASHRV